MAKRGPAPKPSALKELAGNPGKRAANPHEPKPDVGAPACPSHLRGEARKEWERMSVQLVQLRLLTQVDRAALAAYCQCWARWVEAEKTIKKDGMVVLTEKGYPVLSPWWGVAQQSLKQMRAFLVEFGMTPASRSRVQAPTKEEDDPFDEFLRRRSSG